ncbi:MAG: cytochrome P450 [Myxococcota bacterium]
MAAPSTPQPAFGNPFQNPALLADPYPVYAMLRSGSPVFRPPIPVEGPGATILLRFADVEHMLRHPKASVDRLKADLAQRFKDRIPSQLLGEGGGLRSMLMLDGADHTRVRGLVNKAFTPRRVAKLGPRIQQIVDTLLDDALAGGAMDLIDDFAAPLPAIVIAELLGVPAEDHRQFKEWAATLVNSLGEGGPLVRGPEFDRALEALLDYLRGVIAKRRSDPQQDLISGMIAAQEERDALTDQELLSNSLLLLLAGHETTTNLIGNGTLALLRNRDQWEKWVADRDLVEPGIEELLRYDSPVQATVRVPTEDIEIAGQTIPEASVVVCLIGSANRDPEAFDRPDTLDVTRRNVRHLSFGFGEHFCLGAGLARLEAKLAFTSLLDRAPKLELASEQVEHRPNLLLRGLKALPVRVG